LRAPSAAVRRSRARRLPARGAHPRAVEACPAGGALRRQAADPGAPDQADRRQPGRQVAAARDWRGARGPATLHDLALRPAPRRDHYHLGTARLVAGRCQVARRVSRPGRRAVIRLRGWPPSGRSITMTGALSALSKAGVSIWLDDLSRERLRGGSLAELA